jgi:hypothetical protein
VCYDLRIGSPLTLSEVRSMLPWGIVADVASAGACAELRAVLPATRTAAHLRVGACSCDLVRARHPDPREDERHLRRRYASLGLSRERIIRELERHRRRSAVEEPPGGWRSALAGFIAEHARNAGPTLFQLSFQAAPPGSWDRAPISRTVAEVRADPENWLSEGPPVLVVR